MLMSSVTGARSELSFSLVMLRGSRTRKGCFVSIGDYEPSVLWSHRLHTGPLLSDAKSPVGDGIAHTLYPRRLVLSGEGEIKSRWWT